MTTPPPRTTIAVIGPGASRFQPLFSLLERELPVEFSELGSMDGRPFVHAVVLGDVADETVESLERRGTDLYVSLANDRTIVAAESVISEHPLVEGPVRGRQFAQGRLAASTDLEDIADVVLARSEDGIAMWGVRQRGERTTHLSATDPPVFATPGSLTEEAVEGRLADLIPFLHFVYAASRSAGWQPPALRASIVIDDPNLHASRYGSLDFERLLATMRDVGFHTSIASVPLDAWTTRRSVARLFRENADAFSIIAHGNDHTRHELLRPLGIDQYLQLMAQSRVRFSRLRNQGLPAELVQAAPHNRCSQEAADAMARVGYEALTITRPYVDAGDLTRSEDALIGPAAVTPGGLPLILRRHLEIPNETLALDAFLGWPLVLYGHQRDAGQNVAELVRRVDDVNSFGSPMWSSLGDISRSNVATQAHGASLWARPRSRVFDLVVPPGVSEMRVDLSGGRWRDSVSGVSVDGIALSRTDDSTTSIAVEPGQQVRVVLEHPKAVDWAEVPAPGRRAWPIIRRLLAEARDRTPVHLAESGRP